MISLRSVSVVSIIFGVAACGGSASDSATTATSSTTPSSGGTTHETSSPTPDSSTTTASNEPAAPPSGCPMDTSLRVVSHTRIAGSDRNATVVMWTAIDAIPADRASLRPDNEARVIDEATARALGASPERGTVWTFAAAGAAPCARRLGRFVVSEEQTSSGPYYRVSQELLGECAGDTDHDALAFVSNATPTLCRYAEASLDEGARSRTSHMNPPEPVAAWLGERRCGSTCNAEWVVSEARFGTGGTVRGLRITAHRGNPAPSLHRLERRDAATGPWTELTGPEQFDGVFTDDGGIRGIVEGLRGSVTVTLTVPGGRNQTVEFGRRGELTEH